jgi:hypothetical protein
MTKTIQRAELVAAIRALHLDPEEVAEIAISPSWIIAEGRPGTQPIAIRVLDEGQTIEDLPLSDPVFDPLFAAQRDPHMSEKDAELDAFLRNGEA